MSFIRPPQSLKAAQRSLLSHHLSPQMTFYQRNTGRRIKHHNGRDCIFLLLSWGVGPASFSYRTGTESLSPNLSYIFLDILWILEEPLAGNFGLFGFSHAEMFSLELSSICMMWSDHKSSFVLLNLRNLSHRKSLHKVTTIEERRIDPSWLDVIFSFFLFFCLIDKH